MSVLNEAVVRSIIEKTSVPVVFRGYVHNWPLCQWNGEKWIEMFGEREYPFRCVNKYVQSQEPCWERSCTVRNMTFKKFSDAALSSEEAMYFDYKYLHEWFSDNDEFCKEICWEQFGFPDKGSKDTTLWVGSNGAHTPAHQDTYGVNIVIQILGKKRWILFPPESGGLKPTRVPYEESSVYSELNFYCPTDVEVFKGLTGAHVVELSAGDALVVPHKWWHYVQNEDPVNVSLNMWLPHEEDESSRMCEAIIKIFVAQLCKDLSPEQVKRIVNPNEDDLMDTPLADLFFQLEAVSDQCLSKERNAQRAKRQKTGGDASTSYAEQKDYDLYALLANPDNKMELAPIVTGEELVRLIEENKNRCKNNNVTFPDDSLSSSLCLVKPVINAFCQANLVDQFRQNLLSQLR